MPERAVAPLFPAADARCRRLAARRDADPGARRAVPVRPWLSRGRKDGTGPRMADPRRIAGAAREASDGERDSRLGPVARTGARGAWVALPSPAGDARCRRLAARGDADPGARRAVPVRPWLSRGRRDGTGPWMKDPCRFAGAAWRGIGRGTGLRTRPCGADRGAGACGCVAVSCRGRATLAGDRSRARADGKAPPQHGRREGGGACARRGPG